MHNLIEGYPTWKSKSKNDLAREVNIKTIRWGRVVYGGWVGCISTLFICIRDKANRQIGELWS